MTEKETVLAKCGEIAPNQNGIDVLDVAPIGEGKDVIGYKIDALDGCCKVMYHYPQDHPVWPLAAQILGIGDEELPADPLDADRELVKSRLFGCIDGVPQFAAIATNDKTLYEALKRLAGMEVAK